MFPNGSQLTPTTSDRADRQITEAGPRVVDPPNPATYI
jgi:hypothetical protein